MAIATGYDTEPEAITWRLIKSTSPNRSGPSLGQAEFGLSNCSVRKWIHIEVVSGKKGGQVGFVEKVYSEGESIETGQLPLRNARLKPT